MPYDHALRASLTSPDSKESYKRASGICRPSHQPDECGTRRFLVGPDAGP